jgi:Flp pilus assembly protein TadD
VDQAAVNDELRKSILAMGRNELGVAKSGFKRVLERRPEEISALVNLGWIAQREKVWPEAEAYMRRALRLAPENAAVWLALGIAQMEQGSLDHALASLAQVTALEPKNARAHRLLGLTLARKSWYSGAEDELRQSLELDPEDAGAHFNLAVLYLQRSPVAVELARRHYYRALDLGSAPDRSIEGTLAANSEPTTPPKSLPRARGLVR